MPFLKVFHQIQLAILLCLFTVTPPFIWSDPAFSELTIPESPIHQAAKQGDLDSIQNLLKPGTFIDTVDAAGKTPLHCAAENGKIETVKWLVEKGANVNVRAHDGSTPYALASLRGYAKIAIYLKEHGADSSLQPGSASDQVDNLFALERLHTMAGASVSVIRDGVVLYKNGYGYANIELKVSNRPNTRFHIASLTKAFTAMAIMQLHECGKLQYDDPVNNYLPDYPHGDQITIRHLLTHTSGVWSFTSDPDYMRKSRLPMSIDDVVDWFNVHDLDFTPGEKYQYSNSGYVLLGKLIEMISGETYPQFLKSHIFDPLGMKNTQVEHDFRDIIFHRAEGYLYDDQEKRWINCIKEDMSVPGAAGAISSTVEDFYLWDQALYTDQLVKQSSLREAFAPFTLNNGTPSPYGFGWLMDKYRGLKTITHAGGISGFSTYFLRFPEQKFSVVIFCNSDNRNAQSVAEQIADIYLKDWLQPREES